MEVYLRVNEYDLFPDEVGL